VRHPAAAAAAVGGAGVDRRPACRNALSTAAKTTYGSTTTASCPPRASTAARRASTSRRASTAARRRASTSRRASTALCRRRLAAGRPYTAAVTAYGSVRTVGCRLRFRCTRHVSSTIPNRTVRTTTRQSSNMGTLFVSISSLHVGVSEKSCCKPQNK
jgi:hypothetical protein